MNNFQYYADLNPRYGQRYQRRYAVFLMSGPDDRSQTHLHFTTRKAAERNAAKLNEQEADPHYPECVGCGFRTDRLIKQPNGCLLCASCDSHEDDEAPKSAIAKATAASWGVPIKNA